MFELVDLWTKDIEADTYINLLEWLFNSVFLKDTEEVYRWKKEYQKPPTPPPPPPPEPEPEPDDIFADMCIFNVATGKVVQVDEGGELEMAEVCMMRCRNLLLL